MQGFALIVLVAVVVAVVVAIVVNLDPRIPIGFAVVMLALSGLFIAIDNRDIADLFATIAFFTLIFGTLLGFVEFAIRHFGMRRSRRSLGVESDALVERNQD
jgi:hypothetical protein